MPNASIMLEHIHRGVNLHAKLPWSIFVFILDKLQEANFKLLHCLADRANVLCGSVMRSLYFQMAICNQHGSTHIQRTEEMHIALLHAFAGSWPKESEKAASPCPRSSLLHASIVSWLA